MSRTASTTGMTGQDEYYLSFSAASEGLSNDRARTTAAICQNRQNYLTS